MKTPSITIAIPIYNHWGLIPLLLKSLGIQSLSPAYYEILLVDNGSNHIPDNLPLPPNARILHCTQPGSYAARNFAIKEAKGTIFAFTDADCLPDPHWLKTAYDWYQNPDHANKLLAGGITLFAEDPEHATPCELYDLALGIPQKRYTRNGYAVTANLFIPRTVFDTVGLFDDTRFSGGDAAFCRKAAKHNIQLTYLPDSSIRHPARKNWNEITNKVRRVKGGQIKSGSMGRRLQWIIRTLLPPVRAWYFIWKQNRANLTKPQRLSVSLLQARLWGIEVHEMLLLLSRIKKPGR